MANALAVLESALRTRKLDRTLTTALAPLERTDPSALVATDVAALDACLRGGLPRGQLSELVGPRSSGRTALLLQMMAAATVRSEIVALVDAFDRLDAQSAAAAGVDLSRLLWVRGQAGEGMRGWGRGPGGGPDASVERSIKALNLILQAGGFGIVALDLGDASPAELRRVPYTTWLRVQRTIEGSDTACVLLGPEPIARSAGGLTLTLAGRSSWAGTSDRSRRLTGVGSRVQVHSPRRRFQGTIDITSSARL
jgi:recombination protein RecA